MRARELAIKHFLNREEFPKGEYEYKGLYDYFDDGKDYRPDKDFQLRRKISMQRNMFHFLVALVSIATVVGLYFHR